MKLKHFRGVFKTREVEVIEVKHHKDDYYTVKIKADGVAWKAGEHGIFSLPNQKVTGKKWRAFSIASSPKEGYILLGTRTGKTPSSFKSELTNLQSGDKMKLRGPFGWFLHEDKTSPFVLIAGGIGITPIRALLSDLEDSKQPIKVIYASEYYLFKEDLEKITKMNNVEIIYVEGIENTQDKINQYSNEYKNEAKYYISGSMGMIKATKDLLKQSGIRSKNIINDPFLGY